MKTILFLSVLFCAIALPVSGELTETDLNKIRLIIKEEIKEELKPIIADIGSLKTDIVTLKTDVAWIKGKLGSVDNQFEGVQGQIMHVTYMTYALIALIVAAVAIPQILIARRSERDRNLEKQIEKLTQEVEKLKQQRIVKP